MLKGLKIDLVGKNAVVIGRSNIVGKPMAQLLIKESCTVTVAHSKTKDLPNVCRNADILVAAVGRPEMIKGDWVKKGAIVIDVGINRIEIQKDGKTKNLHYWRWLDRVNNSYYSFETQSQGRSDNWKY